MRKQSIRKCVLFEDNDITLELLEHIDISVVVKSNGGYCSLQLEPLAVVVRCAVESFALDTQGAITAIDDLPEAS